MGLCEARPLGVVVEKPLMGLLIWHLCASCVYRVRGKEMMIAVHSYSPTGRHDPLAYIKRYLHWYWYQLPLTSIEEREGKK